jgi:hypothetical protein
MPAWYQQSQTVDTVYPHCHLPIGLHNKLGQGINVLLYFSHNLFAYTVALVGGSIQISITWQKYKTEKGAFAPFSVLYELS